MPSIAMSEYTRYLNDLSSARQPSLVSEMTAFVVKKRAEEARAREEGRTEVQTLIPLSVGVPNGDTFPFKKVTLKLRGKEKLVAIEGDALKTALNYGSSQGVTALIAHLKRLQLDLHSPLPNVWEKSDILLTSGGVEGICRIFEMIMDPGATIILPGHISSLCLSILDPFDPNYLTVESDDLGMIPDSLESMLKSCKKGPDSKTPKVLYINPNGCDPTGVIIPPVRRKRIYQICCDFDLLLLEDDPNFLMTYNGDKSFQNNRSFLSLDCEGRVLRVDSLWSVVGEGMRIGFITGPKPIVKVLELHTQVSTGQVSSFSQAIITKAFDEWDTKGILDEANLKRVIYKKRRDTLSLLMDRQVTRDKFCWSIPAAGNNFWIKVTIPNVTSEHLEAAIKGADPNGTNITHGKHYTVKQNGDDCFFAVSFITFDEREMETKLKKITSALL